MRVIVAGAGKVGTYIATDLTRAGHEVLLLEKSREVYRKWLAMTRSADQFSPDRTRRPYWMLRPLKPAREFYNLP